MSYVMHIYNEHALYLGADSGRQARSCPRRTTSPNVHIDCQHNVQANSQSVQYCPYLSSFLKYLTCNFNDLKLRQFKVIQGQRSWCQSIAQGRFHIRLPLTPSWYLSPFSRYLILKISYFSIGCKPKSELNRK